MLADGMTLALSQGSELEYDLAGADDGDRSEALRRFELIRPVVENVRLPRRVMTERAREAGVDVTTLYRWARTYRETGLLSSLLPYRPAGGRGKSRLEPAVEEILLQTVEERFLSPQQSSMRATAAEVARRCRAMQLKVPHPRTVRARIVGLPQPEPSRRARAGARLEGLAGGDAADRASRPLDVVRIDHAPLNLIALDDRRRLPLGRPWITLAIDMYSRMVLGFSISPDPPGSVAAGTCIAHAVLPKEMWLAKRGVDGSWPCWGFPARIRIDDRREFRTQALRRACARYNMRLEYESPAQPHAGAHIRRLLGSFSRALANLPGAPFAQPAAATRYAANGALTLTLAELELWLTEYIVCIYQTKRRWSEASPLERWTAAACGDGAGTGLLDRPTDEDHIRLDFLPYVERTVQAYGVAIDGIHYYSDVLRRFAGGSQAGSQRSFIFRRDPRDLSTVYLWDPELLRYAAIPYRDATHPPISYWELRELRRMLRRRGQSANDESAIFAAHHRLCDTGVRDTAQREGLPRASWARATDVCAPAVCMEDIAPFDIEQL